MDPSLSLAQGAAVFLFIGACLQIWAEAKTRWSGLDAYLERVVKGQKPRDVNAAEAASRRAEAEWLRSVFRYRLVLGGWTFVGVGAFLGVGATFF